MQSPRVRASSPRPLTRRSSKRDTSSTPSKSSRSGSSFHLPPVSPTTPTNPSSPFTNVHPSGLPSMARLGSDSFTPPPTPAPSPTAARASRHLSFRQRPSDLTRVTSELTRRRSDVTGRQSSLTRRQSDLKQSDPSRRQSGLARKQSGLTRRQSDLTRRRSQSPNTSPAVRSPESPRKVRFCGESVEYLAGDSSDEDESSFSDPELESRPIVISPRSKEQEYSRRRVRESSGHESPRENIAENDNDALRRGRSSSRGAPGKRSATPFARRGSTLSDEEDDEEADDEMEEKRVTHGTRSVADESTLKKGTSYIDGDDKSTSGPGRSSGRGAHLKRSNTPFVKRCVSWEDEIEDEDEHHEEGIENIGNLIVHASSEEGNKDDGAIRRGQSVEDNDDESSLSRRGRSSSRDSSSKRSATPFARRSVNCEDEDDEDYREDVEPEKVNRSGSNAQCPGNRNSENDGEGHVRPERSASENDDEPPSPSRGRSYGRGARQKRSATPFIKRNIYWADESEDDDDENDAQSPNAKGKEQSTAQTSNNVAFISQSATWEGEKVKKVESFGLAVIPETDECITIVKDEDEQSIEQQRTYVMRKNGSDTDECRKITRQGTILDNGDLQVTVPCSCGRTQVLTYSSLTGIDIKPC